MNLGKKHAVTEDTSLPPPEPCSMLFAKPYLLRLKHMKGEMCAESFLCCRVCMQQGNHSPAIQLASRRHEVWQSYSEVLSCVQGMLNLKSPYCYYPYLSAVH